MNDYRMQRLKEDLTMAQQRNKKQRIQLSNYKKCHERDLATIKDLQDRINKTIDKLSFIDEALENDTLNVPLCIAKINKALEILGDNNEC